MGGEQSKTETESETLVIGAHSLSMTEYMGGSLRVRYGVRVPPATRSVCVTSAFAAEFVSRKWTCTVRVVSQLTGTFDILGLLSPPIGAKELIVIVAAPELIELVRAAIQNAVAAPETPVPL